MKSNSPPGPNELAKYAELAGLLREQIRSGALPCGERLPSYAAFKRQGFTNQTIEKAQTQLVSEGLIERRHGSGVFVKERAARPRHGLIGFAGISSVSFTERYWASLLQGVYDVVDGETTQILLLKGLPNSGGWERVDGVLGSGVLEEWVTKLPEGMPAVSLLDRHHQIDGVVADDFSGALKLTEHLIGLGHRRIGYLVTKPILGTTSLRFAGYEAALQRAGMRRLENLVRDIGPHLVGDDPFFQAGLNSMAEWLRDDWSESGCTALLCQNDAAAWGAIRALESAGYWVPGDVSVTGFDAVGREFGSRSLTTIEVPLRKIGAAGARRLLRLVNGDEHERATITLPVELCVGDSAAGPRS